MPAGGRAAPPLYGYTLHAQMGRMINRLCKQELNVRASLREPPVLNSPSTFDEEKKSQSHVESPQKIQSSRPQGSMLLLTSPYLVNYHSSRLTSKSATERSGTVSNILDCESPLQLAHSVLGASEFPSQNTADFSARNDLYSQTRDVRTSAQELPRAQKHEPLLKISANIFKAKALSNVKFSTYDSAAFVALVTDKGVFYYTLQYLAYMYSEQQFPRRLRAVFERYFDAEFEGSLDLALLLVLCRNYFEPLEEQLYVILDECFCGAADLGAPALKFQGKMISAVYLARRCAFTMLLAGDDGGRDLESEPGVRE